MSVYETPLDFKKQIQPMTQLVGIDYGTKRIGVAVSDLMQMTATPLKIVSSLDELEKTLADRSIGGFIIGLPRQMNGEEGEQAKVTRAWAQKLYKKYSLPILFWDERLSSSAVSRIFIEQADLSRKRQKEVMDKVAAAYILQGALDLLGRL
ncbi:MAG: Holliday junction resolvase RuvX [Alphaproteobacteria bacterium]|nr:Holliday junction resolvase RuvX [Alphaproteobacteria bacterium]